MNSGQCKTGHVLPADASSKAAVNTLYQTLHTRHYLCQTICMLSCNSAHQAFILDQDFGLISVLMLTCEKLT